jgi:ribonucleoside-diphosphate reductase alpha chain
MIVPERIVRENTLAYFKGDELATTVWMKKYALKDQSGEFVETGPLDRFETIAREICRIDAKYPSDSPLSYDVVFNLLKNGYFLPGGSALSGIGNDYTVTSLGNCFVISGSNEDSYGSILKNDQEIVQIAKRRGGIGLDISHLRPENSVVLNAAGSSTGAVSFAHRFSNSTREVAQSGRRGALMLSMHINHPDILKFISVKDDEVSVTGANLSVRVTDEFMKAVEEDEIHQLRYPINFPFVKSDHFVLNQVYKGSSGNTFINVKARDIFNKLVEVNWRRAEPGILFWDTVTKESPADGYPAYKSQSTNPCGEIPLSPYDSCRLLSVNATAFVQKAFTKDAFFQPSLFRSVARMVTRIMDNIIDLEIEKIEAIIKKIKADPESDEVKAVELHLWESVLTTTINGRRAGISIIGHGDLLAMLGLKYGSDEATKFVSEIHELFARTVYDESIELSKMRGVFPSFDVQYETADFLKRIGVDKVPRRNIALLTINSI